MKYAKFTITQFPFGQRQIQWQPVASRRLAPLSVSIWNLCHAAALNFITPLHDTDDDSNTRRTCRTEQAPPVLQALADSSSHIERK